MLPRIETARLQLAARAFAAVLAVLFTMAACASAHTTAPTGLVVTNKTQTSVSLDWTQDYVDAYSGYYVRTNGSTRVKYPASAGTVAGLAPNTSYKFCVSIDLTAKRHPDESSQACITTSTLANDPTPPPAAVCADGIDNDSDTLIDYPSDPGCTSASDADEYNAPPPPPTPTEADWSYGFDTWSSTGRLWPAGGLWRPFAATSPFNKPVPASPPLDLNSATMVARMKAWQSGQGGAPNNLQSIPAAGQDYGHPTYYSGPSDRLLTIHCQKYGSGACSGIEGLQVRVPAAAKAADGTDQHISIAEGTRVVDVYNAGTIPASGTWNVGAGALTSLDGTGVQPNTQPGATAAGWSLLVGMLRGQDLASGRIPHQLFGVVNCVNGHVAPAIRDARQCSAIGQPTDGPRLGDWLYLDITDAELDSLTYTTGGAVHPSMKVILKAWREFGFRIGDTGGAEYAKPESHFMYDTMGASVPLQDRGNAEGWTLSGSQRILRYRDLPTWIWDRLRVINPCVTAGTC